MEALNKEVPQYKFLIFGLMALVIAMAVAFWIRDKKSISWESKYQRDIEIALGYVPDSCKREELISKLKEK